MARRSHSPPGSSRSTGNKKSGGASPARGKGGTGNTPSRSVAPIALVPALLLFAVTATLFGINCRERGGSLPPIGTPDRPIGGAVPPGPRTGTIPPSVSPSVTRPPQRPAETQMLLGNPDGATGDAGNRTRFLIQRPQYALSYNDDLHFPNWVAWHLTAQNIGEVERGQFVPDPDLPGNFTKVFTSDYVRTGYDRGHNCPSKDRTATREDNDATFYMTNITPQRHGMNAGPWEELESYCRELAREGNELYIVCGHGFNDARFRRIGPKKVAVPDFGWKFIVALPEQEGDDLRRINNNTRVIAVMMPNSDTSERQDWHRYIVTGAEIEQATGLRLLATLPPSVADALKRKRDNS